MSQLEFIVSVSSQPGKTSSGQNGNNTSSGNNKTGSPFEGKDYNNLTPAELAELKKNYEIRKTNGQPTSILAIL